jgi:hypothetical protein
LGKRREPRKQVILPVRIFGTGADGRVFSESVTTIDVSQNGVRLDGVKSHIKPDEIIGLTHGEKKVHFRVKWIGQPGTPLAGQIGLQNLTPEKPLWDISLPPGIIDNFLFAGKDRRRFPRVKCSISAEIQPPGSPVIWGKISDLSLGGCFIEMFIPLKLNTAFELALWLGTTKVHLQGEVASVSPGFGNGVRFLNISPELQALLQQHLDSLAPSLA